MLIISRCGSHYENYEIDTENEISGKTRILVWTLGSKKDSLCKIFLLNNMDTKLLWHSGFLYIWKWTIFAN